MVSGGNKQRGKVSDPSARSGVKCQGTADGLAQPDTCDWQKSISDAARLARLAEKKRAWRAKNPERAKVTRKAYEMRNRAHILARKREHQRRYRKRKPLVTARIKLNRKAKERGAAGSYSEAEIVSLFEKQGKRCAGCGRPGSLKRAAKDRLCVDHVVLLSKGGSNYISNIQLLCRPCNSAKSNMDPHQWAALHGRLFC